MDLKEIATELGHLGGYTTFKRYGKEHFQMMKKLSDEAKKRKKEADNILVIDKR